MKKPDRDCPLGGPFSAHDATEDVPSFVGRAALAQLHESRTFDPQFSDAPASLHEISSA